MSHIDIKENEYMQLVREKEFVNQYHYDARNLEWEKENRCV